VSDLAIDEFVVEVLDGVEPAKARDLAAVRGAYGTSRPRSPSVEDTEQRVTTGQAATMLTARLGLVVHPEEGLVRRPSRLHPWRDLSGDLGVVGLLRAPHGVPEPCYPLSSVASLRAGRPTRRAAAAAARLAHGPPFDGDAEVLGRGLIP
jgi:hypothetical protein